MKEPKTTDERSKHTLHFVDRQNGAKANLPDDLED